MNGRSLTIAEVLLNAELIDRSLNALQDTAPKGVHALGGVTALANLSEMTCIGPIPRLDQATWERLSREYQDKCDGWA